jgi:hypothetical protein
MAFRTEDWKELQHMLHNEEVVFEFRKKDGSIRQAKGTLIESYLPASNGKSGKQSSDNVVVYWDLDKQGFRSFVKENFVGAY